MGAVVSREPSVADADLADLVISGGLVLGADATFRRQSVVINGKTITAVSQQPPDARRVIDAERCLVIPGLIDMHDHLRTVAPGLSAGEGLPLDGFLKVWWQLLESQGETEYRLLTLASSSRLLRAGVTTVVDHAYTFHKPALQEAILASFRASGIRWYFARGLMTRPYEPICEPRDRAFERIRDLVESASEGRDRVLVAPVSLRQATAEDYAASRKLADKLGVRLYTHVAETDAEVADSLREYGQRPIQLLHQVGFTGPDVTLVHCVKLDETDRAILRDTRTNVVHCPSNHMKLAKGVTDVPGLLAQGVNVSLGIDQMSDLFTEMRNESLMQGLANANPAILSKEQVVAMATANGAAALVQSGALGVIAAGARADVVVVDLRGLHHAPVVDPLYELVFNTRPSDVRWVVVDGRLVVDDGRLTLHDESALERELQDLLAHYLRRTGNERLLPEVMRRHEVVA
jgi:5-methylthioadenosine/S-adenosylhomocysteine deaminase